MYLIKSTPTADAMCILNEWLESLRSLGNSSLRERVTDSSDTEKRKKHSRLKGNPNTTSVTTVLRNVLVLPPASFFLTCFIPHHFSSGSTY